MGRPNHHTTRIDANPPRYRTCDSHRIRLAQRLLNPSRAFYSTSPLQSSIKLAFPSFKTAALTRNGERPCLFFRALRAQSVACCFKTTGLRLRGVCNFKTTGRAPSCRVGASFVYRMYRLASSRTKEAFWRARACADCRDYKPTPEATRFYSRLVGIGYRWGISIDRSSSPTSLTSIRYNFTSRPGQKKERASLGWPSYADAYFLFS